MPGDLSVHASPATATLPGATSTTWSGRARRALQCRCSTSTTRATRSPKPPRRQAQRAAGANIARRCDEDGTFCSSDYYLRITADGGRMLKANSPSPPPGPPNPPPAAAADPADRQPARLNKPASASSPEQRLRGRQAAPSTPTSAATGRAPTARSRSGCRSTSAPPCMVNRVVLEAAAGLGDAVPDGPDPGQHQRLAVGSTLRAERRVTFNPASGNTVTLPCSRRWPATCG